jgi:hypothetical protein
MSFAKVQKGAFGYAPTWVGISIIAIWIPFALVAWVAQVVVGVESMDSKPAQSSTAETAPSPQLAQQPTTQATESPSLAAQTSSLPNVQPSGAAAQTLTAVFTCKLEGEPLSMSACFSGSSDSPGGSIKIQMGSQTKEYTAMDIVQTFPGVSAAIPLGESYNVVGQMNGADGMVLRLEIRDGTGKSIYSDETSGFGVVTASG